MTLDKAKNAYWGAWRMGLHEGELSAKGAARVWEVVVKSVAGYLGELEYGEWPEVEKLQRMAGRAVLGVGQEVPDEVVLGELGWWSMRASLTYSRLMYLHKLRRSKGVMRAVFELGCERVSRGVAVEGEWCFETDKVLRELELGDLTTELGPSPVWRERVTSRIASRERRTWREGLLGKVKLKCYAQVKQEMRMEEYLTGHRKEVGRLVKLRAGVTRLEVEKGRWKTKCRWERVCKMCKSGEVEDVVHLIEGCEAWTEERAEVRRAVREECRTAYLDWMAGSPWERVVWLLREVGGKKMRKARKVLDEWVRKRERVEKR